MEINPCSQSPNGQHEAVTENNVTFCAICGKVLEENEIVSEIGFVEGANGSSSVIGQFVSNTGRSYRKGLHGYSKESRERTIENGRKRITQVANQLRLGGHHVEAAQRLFMLAVQHNYIQGRRTQNVVAACLYIVCRREKTPRFVIISYLISQTNVYELGHTFLGFCRLLNLQLPIIDPSLYIQRFASKLGFEEKTHMVANTALRLVQRMKRDWLQTGRRPSGICGASLLIAARLHGFLRTQKQIIEVVRICDVTLRKRLLEFEQTPSGSLTAEEFETVDLEEEADPPAFTRSRQKEKNEKMLEQKIAEEKAALAASPEQQLPEADIAKEMEEALGSEEFRQMEKEEAIRKGIEENESLKRESPEKESPEKEKVEISAKRTKVSMDGEDDTFSDIDDTELDALIATESEVKIKEEIWIEMNKDYLAQQAEKQRIAAEKPPPKKRRKVEKKKEGPAETAAEATIGMLKKKVSAKINYSALEGLFSVDQKLFDSKNTRMEKLTEDTTEIEEEDLVTDTYDNQQEEEYDYRDE